MSTDKNEAEESVKEAYRYGRKSSVVSLGPIVSSPGKLVRFLMF